MGGSVVGKTESAPSAAQRLVKELEKDHDEQVRTVQARRLLRDMNKDREIADLRAETAELRGAKGVEDLLVFALEADKLAQAEEWKQKLEREKDLRAEVEAVSRIKTYEAEAYVEAKAQKDTDLLLRCKLEEERRARDARWERVMATRDTAPLRVASHSPPRVSKGDESQSAEVLRNLRRIVASCRAEQVSAMVRNDHDSSLRGKLGIS